MSFSRQITEPFSPEPATQGRGSARRCGKDGRGVSVARMGPHRPTPPRTFPRHHVDPGQSGGLPGEKGSLEMFRGGCRRSPQRPRPIPSSSKGAFCSRERRLELHSRMRSARLSAGRRPRSPAPRPADPVGSPERPSWSPSGPWRPSRTPWRRRMSKSATKARIEPERARRIVDIPRFSSQPIPARGAFVADFDTPPPQAVTEAPPAPPHAHPHPFTAPHPPLNRRF